MDWIIVACLALVAISVIASLYFSISGTIELSRLMKEVKLKIKEMNLKIKEIEFN